MDDMSADPTPLLLSIKERQEREREEQAQVGGLSKKLLPPLPVRLLLLLSLPVLQILPLVLLPLLLACPRPVQTTMSPV